MSVSSFSVSSISKKKPFGGRQVSPPIQPSIRNKRLIAANSFPVGVVDAADFFIAAKKSK